MNNKVYLLIHGFLNHDNKLEEFNNFGEFRKKYPSFNPGVLIHDNYMLMTLKEKYKNNDSITELLNTIPEYTY